jgi:hypothetical protein
MFLQEIICKNLIFNFKHLLVVDGNTRQWLGLSLTIKPFFIVELSFQRIALIRQAT